MSESIKLTLNSTKYANVCLISGVLLILIVPGLDYLKKHGLLQISFKWYSVLVSLPLGYGILLLVLGLALTFSAKKE